MADKNCCLLAFYNKELSNYSCPIIKCKNYQICQETIPKCIINKTNNLCMDCNLIMGKHSQTKEVKTCPYCFNTKPMIILNCKHYICNDCWYYMTLNNFLKTEEFRIKCPYCNLN